MNAPRNITVRTVDHGPVTVPEPSWCTGQHPEGGYRVDITHVGAEHVLTLPTRSGPAVVLATSLEARPFVADGFLRGPFVSVYVDGAHFETGLPGLEAMADALTGHAEQLRECARELAVARVEGGAR